MRWLEIIGIPEVDPNGTRSMMNYILNRCFPCLKYSGGTVFWVPEYTRAIKMELRVEKGIPKINHLIGFVDIDKNQRNENRYMNDKNTKSDKFKEKG